MTLDSDSLLQAVRSPCTLLWPGYDGFDDTDTVLTPTLSGRLKGLLCIIKPEAMKSSTRAPDDAIWIYSPMGNKGFEVNLSLCHKRDCKGVITGSIPVGR
jgi:hypothetical protein